MTVTLELPEETEAQLREVAERQGRALSDYILEAALEQTRREEQAHAARLEALQELTRLNEEMGLYEWEASETKPDADAGRSA